jgi:hypothetical protein
MVAMVGVLGREVDWSIGRVVGGLCSIVRIFRGKRIRPMTEKPSYLYSTEMN